MVSDLNWLITLDALLAEGSVAGAARKLQLSPSAMSRALTRVREVTGDPLLVRAGRNMVPTPRAIELQERVRTLVREAQSVLAPNDEDGLASLDRIFTVRVSDGFVENFGAALISRTQRDAPGVTLRFVQKLDKESTLLRDGSVDLETGVAGERTSPEIRMRALFRDRFIAVVRPGHALAGQANVSLDEFLAYRHVAITRRGVFTGPVDDALAALGRQRNFGVMVGGFSAAIALARDSELIACVPHRHTGRMREGVHSFELPIAVTGFTVSMMWHPRMEADTAHKWLRGCIYEVCNEHDEPRRDAKTDLSRSN